jgi:hypothetical protein
MGIPGSPLCYVPFGFTVLILIFGKAREMEPKMNRTLIGISAIALLCFGLHQVWLEIH